VRSACRLKEQSDPKVIGLEGLYHPVTIHPLIAVTSIKCL
jgi:hypothetical protein